MKLEADATRVFYQISSKWTTLLRDETRQQIRSSSAEQLFYLGLVNGLLEDDATDTKIALPFGPNSVFTRVTTAVFVDISRALWACAERFLGTEIGLCFSCTVCRRLPKIKLCSIFII